MNQNKAVQLLLLCIFCWQNVSASRLFPENFKFGVSTSAYQIEGGWNASDKGENIWDHLTHFKSDLVADNSNGDITCNSYKNFKRDVEMLVELGVDRYRFSLSWTRLCPTGFCNTVSSDGINYYNKLIDELIANDIEPVVTIFHLDLPQRLQDLGGLTNPYIIDYYLEYAKVAFDNFGDRVKMWITVNEPKDICMLGYGKNFYAPAMNSEGIGDYLCTGNILKAHAKAYRLYQEKYKEKQQGKVGITLSMHWFEPADNSTESIRAAQILRDFENGMYANPIFSKEGNYPVYVRERTHQRSMELNFNFNRLRPLDKEDVELIRGTSDFFGINHYTTKYAKMATPEQLLESFKPSWDDDHRIYFYVDEAWTNSGSIWLKVVPWGFTKLLKWIKVAYDNPEIIVFENGMPDHGEMDDTARISYIRSYLNALLDAVDEGCNVTGYMVWTLMDNFEWLCGYTEPYGLYHVNFTDPERTRTPKSSARFYRQIIEKRKL